jgi:hypothetical protein
MVSPGWVFCLCHPGPTLTYVELLTKYPERITDREWERVLYSGQYPEAPAWTKSVRWSDPPEHELLQLPPTRPYLGPE